MDLKEVKKVVSAIKASLFKNSNSYSIGMLKSHFKGTGLQFKEHQVYTHGDDVRFIDWKLLAKTNTPYIKTFDEERNVEIVVVLDASPSMFNGYNNISKLQSAIEICCLLYLLAEETKDFIHVLILGKEVHYIPQKNGDAGIVTLISELGRHGILQKTGKINLKYYDYDNYEENSERESYNNLMKHVGRRREIVILSDLNKFLDMNELRKLVYRKHVHCFRITSPLDYKEKQPFMLLTKDLKRGTKKMAQVFSKGNRELESVLGNQVKTLRLEDRYLEEFVKEML